MNQAVAHDLNDADESILEILSEGRNLPQNIADQLDYSRQYVQNRLQMLKAADYVKNRGGGLYEITDDGLDEMDIEPSAADELAEELQECREQLQQARAELEAASDDPRVAKLEESVEAALTAISGQHPDVDMAKNELEAVVEGLDDE